MPWFNKKKEPPEEAARPYIEQIKTVFEDLIESERAALKSLGIPQPTQLSPFTSPTA